MYSQNNMYVSGVQRKRANSIPAQYVSQPNIRQDYPQYKEISPEANYALSSYAIAGINKPLGQMSFDKLIASLERKGKRIGKDFEIEDCKMGNVVVLIKNKQGQEEKRIHYDNGNLSKWNCYEETKYCGDKKVKQIYKDDNNKIRMYSDYYQNDEIPQSYFTKGGMTYDTTPQEYIEYLKENKINYKVEYSGEEDNNRSIHISEYDNDDKLITRNWYYYGERRFDEHPMDVSQGTYDSDEAEIKRVTFYGNKETEVTTYLEKLKR